MTTIEQAAIDFIRAEQEATFLKGEYRVALEAFFSRHGRPEGAMHVDDDRFLPAMNATNTQYQAFQKAKRRKYNAHRRLRTAVARAGGAQ